MPHYFDFNVFKKEDIRNIEIRNLQGWINPLVLEYAYGNFLDTKTTLYWRVKGTAHTFTIPASQFNKLVKGDAETHFRNALTSFREDILDWYNDNAPAEWMREYIYMFKNYITF